MYFSDWILFRAKHDPVQKIKIEKHAQVQWHIHSLTNKISKLLHPHLGKGSKIKLIIFAEFSVNGGWVPPIRENN